jgi:acetate kinase
MKVLVLNCGSSTVKFQLIDTDAELSTKNEDRFLAKGVVEKIGTTEALIRLQSGQDKPAIKVAEILNHKSAIEECLNLLRSGDAPFIGGQDNIRCDWPPRRARRRKIQRVATDDRSGRRRDP